MRILLLFLVMLPIMAHATIYMEKDTSGNPVYSDTPLTNNAQQIEAPATGQISSAPSAPAPAKTSEASTAATDTTNSDRKPYTKFSITSPADQETIWSQPVVTVAINIEPALQKDDKIQLFLDGVPYGQPMASTELPLNHIDRGTHKIAAGLIIDGKVWVKTSNHTIYIHYASVAS